MRLFFSLRRIVFATFIATMVNSADRKGVANDMVKNLKERTRGLGSCLGNHEKERRWANDHGKREVHFIK